MATLAGVSSATVSYVVNGGPRSVSTATRERVLAAIAALNYHPDAVARSLRSRHTRVLGLVIPDNANAFFAELARRVEHSAHLRGYSIFLCNSQEDVERERQHLATLRDRRVDGIVLIPADAPDGGASATIDDVPVLALDRVPPAWNGDAVAAEGRGGGALAVRHLLALGHRRIGLIHGPQRLAHARARLQGCLDALDEAGIAADPALRREGAFDYVGGWETAKTLLSLPQPPTALCCSNDALAVGALAAAHALGAAVPRDVSVTGFDDVPIAAYTVPPLTTVQQPYAAMADVAVELLLARIAGRAEAQSPTRRLLDVDLVVRSSTAPPRER